MLDMLDNIEKDETAAFSKRNGISLIGHSNAVTALRQMVMIATQNVGPLAIIGPDKSGKEDIAATIHERSAFSKSSFFPIDCRAVDTSFNFDAMAKQSIAPATFYLDNFSQLSIAGADIIRQLCLREKPRIIISAHRDSALAHAENFLNMGSILSIPVPSLSARRQDIPLLLEACVQGLERANRFTLERAAMDNLKAHDWPENLDELKGFVRRAGRKYGGKRISQKMADELLKIESYIPGPPAENITVEQPKFDLRAHLADEEKKHLKWALDHANGVIQHAAGMTGLKRTTFLAKMRKYGLG